jgi:hypothetical protein
MSFIVGCIFCGRPMQCKEYGRPRMFCTDSCRKRHRKQVLTDMDRAEMRRALLEQWGHEFAHLGVSDLLRDILNDYGVDAAGRAAAAIRRATAEDRRWTEIRRVAETNAHGRQFAALLERRDPRVAKFLEECGL